MYFVKGSQQQNQSRKKLKYAFGKAEMVFKMSRVCMLLTLVLLNCFNCIFCHLKLELLTQFPASNDKKYRYCSKIYIF